VEATSTDSAGGTPTDGRTARAVKTRAVIVDALLELLDEGDLQPPANRIAERAGISLRLIYHHFGDLEALFRAAAARQAERMVEIFDPVPTGLPLEERIPAFVEQRSSILEWLTPVRRASLLHEPFSEELTKARDALTEIAETQVRELLGEAMTALPEHEKATATAALNAVTSWSFWDSLRVSGRSIEEARAAMLYAVTKLLGR
jgi:TetR/AcrR family transcriptional regulator, regulator of autoinduction and epiphytic fitness